MGVTSSFPESNLSQDEITRLSKRFKKLDTDKSGTLCLKELLDLPQIKQNPLARRIIGKDFNHKILTWKFNWAVDVLDNDDSGEIDFNEFVQGMSKFSSKAEKKEKLMFAFRIYDIDNDGFISNGELYQVIKWWRWVGESGVWIGTMSIMQS